MPGSFPSHGAAGMLGQVPERGMSGAGRWQGGIRVSAVLDLGLGYHRETGSCRGCSGFGVMEGDTPQFPATGSLDTHPCLKLFLYILGKKAWLLGVPGPNP